MSLLLDIYSVLMIGAGVVFFAAGTVGLWRFPDTLSRLHALTKADGLGLGLVTLGLLPMAGSVLEGAKILLIWLLVMLSGACAAQLIAERLRREKPR